jgi:hypothetical protein
MSSMRPGREKNPFQRRDGDGSYRSIGRDL